MVVAVPDEQVAEALGDIPGRIEVWDAAQAPTGAIRDAHLVCLPHYAGGKKVYGYLEQLPDLRLLQLPSAGFEHARPFVQPGLRVANAAGVHDTRVAEAAVMMALASQRLLPEFLAAARRHEWAPKFFTPSLADRQALILGYGSIGQAISKRLQAFEVPVWGAGRTARTGADGVQVFALADLPGILPQVEILFVVLPHDEHTDRLVDADFLARLPDNALLVNVGRGATVDTDALLAELTSGRLRAALDVTDPEPLPSDHPLWSAPNCIILPHVAGATELTNRRYLDLVRAQIRALHAGETPLNLVL